MWLWRKLVKIKWQDKICNDEVLTIVDESRCLIKTIGERKKELYRTCIEERWIVERRAGGKNVGEQTARRTKYGNDKRTKGNRDESR